jgi:hypothetical protein
MCPSPPISPVRRVGEKICPARWGHINCNEQATKYRYTIHDARTEWLNSFTEERIHRIESKTHPATVADVAPKISHRPMNVRVTKGIVSDFRDKVRPRAGRDEGEATSCVVQRDRHHSQQEPPGHDRRISGK